MLSQHQPYLWPLSGSWEFRREIMKLIVKILKEVEVQYLQVDAHVRYWEDTKVNGVEDEQGTIPCREGESWKPLIDLHTGQILNWTKGTTADVHYKVCDAGNYQLLDENKFSVVENDGYVPSLLAPKSSGYGDYIIMDIDENGFIQKWKPDLSSFYEEDETMNVAMGGML